MIGVESIRCREGGGGEEVLIENRIEQESSGGCVVDVSQSLSPQEALELSSTELVLCNSSARDKPRPWIRPWGHSLAIHRGNSSPPLLAMETDVM